MVLKMNTSVEFCGAKRKFKRCPNKTLIEYQQTIEDIQKETVPLVERRRDFQFNITELNDEIESIDKHIELLEKLDEPNDEEIRECIDLVKDKVELQKRIHNLRVENDNIELEEIDKYNDLDKKLRENYGVLASLIFEDFKEDEIDEADSTDLTLAPRLPEIYRLATTGAKQKDIDKAIQKIIKDSFQ